MAAGAPARATRGAEPPFTIETAQDYIRSNAATLREAGYDDLAASLEALNIAELFHDLEQLEQRLTAIEEKMIARLRAAATEQALFEARRSFDSEMKAYRSKMSADQLAMLEKQFLERRILQSAKLPRLSLFYLLS